MKTILISDTVVLFKQSPLTFTAQLLDGIPHIGHELEVSVLSSYGIKEAVLSIRI